MEWTRETLRKFIEIYRENQCLWKKDSGGYTNKIMKNRAYDKLVEFCVHHVSPKADKDFVIGKIQSLRGAYRRERNKVIKSVESGKRSNEVHQPTLWYYDLLHFTKDQDITLSIVNDSQNINTEPYEESDEEVKVENDNTVEIDDDDPLEETPARRYAPEEFKMTVPKYSHRESVLGKRRKTASMSKDLKRRFMLTCQRKSENNKELSEFELVGINVRRKLEKMDSLQAIHAERLIGTIIAKGLLKELTAKTGVFENDPSNCHQSN